MHCAQTLRDAIHLHVCFFCDLAGGSLPSQIRQCLKNESLTLFQSHMPPSAHARSDDDLTITNFCSTGNFSSLYFFTVQALVVLLRHFVIFFLCLHHWPSRVTRFRTYRPKTQMVLLTSGVLAAAFFLFSHQAYAASVNYRAPDVNIFDGAKVTKEGSFLAFSETFRGGGSVAVGDVNGDGKGDIIIGAGPGGGPQVRVFASDGALVSEFFAYDAGFRGGVKVAACDFDGDGSAEIVVAPGQGGSPHVRIVTQDGAAKFSPGFYPFVKSFKGGVNVACGDVDGDGLNDVVVGVGIGASPSVKVFDRYGVSKNRDLIPFADRDRGGVSVAVGNVDGGAESEIITAIYRFGRSLVKTYKANAKRTVVAQFEGWPESFQGGFQIAAGDLDRDGLDEVLVSLASGGGPQIRAFEAYGKTLPQNFFPYEKTFRGGTQAAIGDVNADGSPEIVTMPGKNVIRGRTDYQQYVEVRLSEQRLYAYENGLLVRTFLVSTGIDKYPTPEGTFAISAKIPKKDYEWSYGENNPDNYNIKDVQWNLRFAPTLYLHYAYWHNSFGKKRSHGCVNINKVNSEWIYNWATLGMPVIIRQ